MAFFKLYLLFLNVSLELCFVVFIDMRLLFYIRSPN